MNMWDIKKAIGDAESQINLANTHIGQAASLLVGRLRISKVSQKLLKKLKTELRDFNMLTGEWKE